MKLRKAIAYAYPTSPHAVDLGCARTGCYYVSQSILREDGTWSPPYIEQGHDSFQDRFDPDLLALFAEVDGEPCPHWQASLARFDEMRSGPCKCGGYVNCTCSGTLRPRSGS